MTVCVDDGLGEDEGEGDGEGDGEGEDEGVGVGEDVTNGIVAVMFGLVEDSWAVHPINSITTKIADKKIIEV